MKTDYSFNQTHHNWQSVPTIFVAAVIFNPATEIVGMLKHSTRQII